MSAITTNNDKCNNIANYIIGIVKSVNKTKDYAISIVEWYTNNNKEDNEVKRLINERF